ncbi:dihydrofolate reductase family protein [Pseudonocardia sp.]|jgi:dihydrofolate reductase|uniref:dihydrofolate reductase family protein n=1 Tax=Pseudonocardia sp. TaxID=60912 RepID=UPI0031FBE469
MRKVIEYTLVSIDGVFAGPQFSGFSEYQDDAYMRDGLGQLLACDAMLMGRTTYQFFAKLWPGRTHPWADRLNGMRKYVFSSRLERADWENSIIIRGDVAAEVTQLKQQDGGNLLVYGHGLLAETLLAAHLLDVLDVSVYPVLVGSGRLLFRENENAKMKLLTTKTFSKIVKMTYEPQYGTNSPIDSATGS